MARRIETVTGVPVVPITYDGTASPKNNAIIPYLQYSRAAKGKGKPPLERTG